MDIIKALDIVRRTLNSVVRWGSVIAQFYLWYTVVYEFVEANKIFSVQPERAAFIFGIVLACSWFISFARRFLIDRINKHFTGEE